MTQVISARMIMQAEPIDEYLDRNHRHHVEQVRQDKIHIKKFWMDALKDMVAMLLVFALAVLMMCSIATATPVDSAWHRSDEAPETATEPEAAAWTWGDYAMAGVGGLFVLAALWGAMLWLRGDAR